MPRPETTRDRTVPLILLTLLVLLTASAAPAFADDDEVGEIEIESYGEFLYSALDFGPDQTATPEGSAPDHRARIDVPRVTVELETHLGAHTELEIEIEFEHFGAGGAIELEYEEFGEYEQEVENGGEITLEKVHVTHELGWHDAFVRAGRFTLPIGLSNRFYHPTEYLTSLRPESERSMIPVSWFEMGIAAGVTFGPVTARAMIVNGLDSTGFDSKFWIVGGHQRRFEEIRATDLAGVVDLHVALAPGFDLGGALYHGGSADNRPKLDMESTDADVTIVDAFVRYWQGPWRASATFLRGHLENSDVVSAKNGRLSVNLGVPRTPVAEVARSFALEVGVDVLALLDADAGSLLPFVRYEEVDTMHDVTGNVFADPRFQRSLTTVGLAYAPHPAVLIKTDYAMRSLGADRFRDENTWSLGLGFETP